MFRRRAAAVAAPSASLPRRRAVLGLSLSIVGLALLSASLFSSSSSFATGPGSVTRQRGEAVAMRAKRLDTTPRKEGLSPFYSTLDRERLARKRRESREEMRERKKVGLPQSTLNYEMLPSVEDIYSREFSGNGTSDPIGGRKRYTIHVLYKHDPAKSGPAALKKNMLEYISFFKYRMSCRSVEARAQLSPHDLRSAVTTLEYPMKEYGEVPKGQKIKKEFQKAIWVKFDFYAPPNAIDYIKTRIYKDNAILRHMVLGHTREFHYLGEDNELHL